MMINLFFPDCPAVVPVLIGPLTTLLALLPALLVGLAGLFKPSGAKRILRFLWHQKLLSLVLLLAIWYFFWGPKLHLFEHADLTARNGAAWTAFRGGPSRRAAITGDPEPTAGEPVWNYAHDAKVLSSPSVVGNRVYVATVVDLGQFTNHGAIVCLDADTGAEQWRYAPGDYHATFSSPAVTDDFVICGEGLHWDTSARIVCLDKKTGHLVWAYTTNGHLECSPTVVGDRIYVGAGLDGYYCLELHPDAQGHPVVRWRLDPKLVHISDCESPPLVVNGVVYVGFGTLGADGQANRIGPGGIMALNADTGAELWRIDTPCPVFAPPALDGDKLYIGMGIGDFVNDWVHMKAPAPIGQVWCIDRNQHTVDWRFEAQDAVLSAVVPVGDHVYFGSRDGHFYALTRQGHLAAQFDAHEAIVTSPAVGDEYTYFATVSGRLYCLRADTLDPVWNTGLGSGDGFMSSPCLARGHIYIGTAENGLRCIGRPGEKPLPLWRDGERGGMVGTSFVPAKVDLAWRYPKTDTTHFTVTAPLTPHADAVFAAGDGEATGDQPAPHRLLKLKADRALEDDARVEWTAIFPNSIVLPPTALGDDLFVVDGRPGDAGRALTCVATDTGKPRWTIALPPQADGRFTLDRDCLYLWSQPDRAAAFERTTGRLLWQTEPAPAQPVAAPVIAGDYLILARAQSLAVHDNLTGTCLWTTAVTDTPVDSVLVVNNSILIAGSKGLFCRSLIDGKLQWSAAVGACATPPIRIGSLIAVITTSHELCLIQLADGAKKWTLPDANSAVPPLPIGTDHLLYRDAKDLTQVDLETGKTSRWYGPANWLGPNRTPLVFLHQQLCFGTTSKGVVCLSPRK